MGGGSLACHCLGTEEGRLRWRSGQATSEEEEEETEEVELTRWRRSRNERGRDGGKTRRGARRLKARKSWVVSRVKLCGSRRDSGPPGREPRKSETSRKCHF